MELHHLRCPTCGSGFGLPPEVRWEEDEDEFLVGVLPTNIKLGGRYYVTCTAGHKWSLKTLWRRENEVDRVLLGDYLGDAP